MSKLSKILTGSLFIFITLALCLVGWLLFGKKSSLSPLTSWKLPGISQVDTSNTPGKLFGPQEDQKATELTLEKVLEWTNKYRQDENLPQLSVNNDLINAADTKVKDMFSKQYFEHVSPTGTTPAQLVLKSGYNYKITGENLALGDFKNEKDLVDAWMASPGHRANILNPEYKEIGISTELNDYQGRNTWLAVQEFGQLAPNCTKPDQNLSNKIDDKKTEYETLAEQMEILAQDAQNLSNQANEKIEQGNTIFAQTRSKTKAQPYWDEGQALRKQSQQKFADAQAIDEQLKNLYDQIQILITQYNFQVNSYNQCIKQ